MNQLQKVGSATVYLSILSGFKLMWPDYYTSFISLSREPQDKQNGLSG